MTVLEWSAVVTAAAFVVLVAGLLIGVSIALRRISAVQSSAASMQQEVHTVANQVSTLVEPTEQTIRALHRQLQSASRLFEAAGQIGGTIEHTTSAVNRVSSVLSQSAVRHAERAAEQRQIGEAFEWAELGMAAWQLWQTNRKRHDGSEAVQQDEGHHKNEGSN
ncbi:MAG: DUF948 domain-containing protein [Candidatus Pristimantibacillus sp.]